MHALLFEALVAGSPMLMLFTLVVAWSRCGAGLGARFHAFRLLARRRLRFPQVVRRLTRGVFASLRANGLFAKRPRSDEPVTREW